MFTNASVFFGVCIYFCIGVGAVFVGPCAVSIREEIRSIRGNPDVPPWKVLAFAIIVAVVVAVFWPIAVPSAWQSQKQKGLSQRSGLFDLMNAMAVIDPLEGDVLPGAKGEYGASPENPVPTRSIMGSGAYLSRIRSRFGDEVEHERIGSFGSGITDSMVDGYRILSREGEELGTIYLCPYCTRNATRAPAGFAMAGDAFLTRPAAEATVAVGEVEDEIVPQEGCAPVDETPTDALAELRLAAIDRSDALAQFNPGPRMVDLSAPDTASSEGLDVRSTVDEWPEPEAATAAPATAPSRRTVPRRRDDDFGFPKGIPQDKLDFRLFIRGVRKGQDCLSRACEIMQDEQLREKHGLDANLGMDRVGRMVAMNRGLLERDTDRGMEDTVDGSDGLFDQRRAVFISGVLEGIDGADPDELADQIKAGIPLDL